MYSTHGCMVAVVVPIKKLSLGLFCVYPSFLRISSRFFDKNSQIFLDNARVRGYSMFAFRVNKERKKTQKSAYLDRFIITAMPLK